MVQQKGGNLLLAFIALSLIGLLLYWIVLPKRSTPSEEITVQPAAGVLPLGGESQ